MVYESGQVSLEHLLLSWYRKGVSTQGSRHKRVTLLDTGALPLRRSAEPHRRVPPCELAYLVIYMGDTPYTSILGDMCMGNTPYTSILGDIYPYTSILGDS